MRVAFLVGFLLSAPSIVLADQTIAGDWKADLGSNVEINMKMSADGQWSSVTLQDNKTIAKMDGTYEQTAETSTKGKLVFTPTSGSKENGTPEVEHDAYELTDAKILSLTSDGDTMVFHKE